jgi:Transposase
MAITTTREQRRRENHERALAADLEHHAAAVALISRIQVAVANRGTVQTDVDRCHGPARRRPRSPPTAGGQPCPCSQIGVDTHKHTHTAAVVTPTGRLVDHRTVPTDQLGAQRMLAFAHGRAPGRRVWAIEGTGAYGTGLTSALLEQGEWVDEIDRPRRARARTRSVDALHALVVSAPEDLPRRLRLLGTRELTAR